MLARLAQAARSIGKILPVGALEHVEIHA
jgi:hypothetical protein